MKINTPKIMGRCGKANTRRNGDVLHLNISTKRWFHNAHRYFDDSTKPC